MTIGFILLSTATIYIWFYYFRKIDIFERENLKDMFLYLAVGALCGGIFLISESTIKDLLPSNQLFLTRVLNESFMLQGVFQEMLKHCFI